MNETALLETCEELTGILVPYVDQTDVALLGHLQEYIEACRASLADPSDVTLKKDREALRKALRTATDQAIALYEA